MCEIARPNPIVWALLLGGCAVDPTTVFPWGVPEPDGLEPYETVRWEREDWDPTTDREEAARYLLKAANHRPSAAEPVLDHFAVMRGRVPPLGDGPRLSFVGDAMWVGADGALDVAAAALLDGDLRVGNLETPLDPASPTELGALGLYAFNSPPALLDALPLDVVQVTNNHAYDAGPEGLDATLAEVAARGRLAVGVGDAPTVDVDGVRVAFLAYTWGINQRGATVVHDLHVVPFGHPEPVDLSRLEAEVAAAREDADAVVLLLHWGFEYEYYPDPQFLRMARAMVAAGADVVVGSGPHVVQPPEICEVNRGGRPGVGRCALRTDDGEPRTAAILYSLGDFATVVPTVPCEVGLVATVSLGPDVTGLGWAAVASVEDGDRVAVRPLDELVDERRYADEAERLAVHLGEGWRR